jgi:hypothetical protein
MATTNIDTTAPGYTTRLGQLQDIVAFYGPIIAEYLKVHIKDPVGAKAWRQADPMLRELLNIHRQIESRIGGDDLD